ncbi:MAG: PIN domain-containing protein [Acidobacteria bacterium]|nr:PIN domain-containing protein [Acidobacteriota bacterium]
MFKEYPEIPWHIRELSQAPRLRFEWPNGARIAVLIHTAFESGTASISYQVVQETLNVLVRRFVTPASGDDARRFLDQVLVPLWRIMPSQGLYHRSLDIQARYGYGLYDAMIIAAALEAGCTRLCSEDLQHGQQIDALTMENPFRG